MNPQILPQVQKIAAPLFAMNSESIIPTARFKEDLGADSLDMVEFTMAVEDEFGVSISDEDAAKITTVADLVEYLEERV